MRPWEAGHQELLDRLEQENLDDPLGKWPHWPGALLHPGVQTQIIAGAQTICVSCPKDTGCIPPPILTVSVLTT
jgi:hypothetical protein